MAFITKDCVYSLPKKEFFEEWLKHDKNEKNKLLFEFISSKFNFKDISDESAASVKQTIASISAKFDEKWQISGRVRDRFLSKNKTWLEGRDILFHVRINRTCPLSSSEGSRSVGRPLKDFEKLSLKSKKRRVEGLLSLGSADELTVAAELATRQEGHRNKAKQIRDIRENSSRLSAVQICDKSRQLSADEALAFYIDSKSTTHSYKQARKWSMKAGHNVFPSYHRLSKAKMSCCPSQEHISVTETRAEIKLQAILDKTTERLIQAQEEVIRSLLLNSSFTLISKWGCDGSSGHSTYKQKFENSDATDEFLFVYSLVPLRLLGGDKVIWQNPRPSSTLYCRPMKFIFSKETIEFTTAETNKVLEEVGELLPTLCKVNGFQISVKHDLLFTMTDGKVCNALTETRSSQRCYICGSTPKMMNDEASAYSSNPDRFKFGLSTLHTWIRCFECLLHISYRLDIKKWQVRKDIDKANLKQRSDRIKMEFKTRMGLIVDKPKPGYGNTNDGNTARRFFSNAELSSKITGLNEELIKKINVLLRALSSGYDINCDEFEKACVETRKLYLSLYSWYYMPVTLHKLLIHNTEVTKSCLLPIGQLSEEAQEARNNDYRRFREHRTRKWSRVATNMDLLKMLIISSDPLINSLREVPRKKKDKLSAEVLKLLVPPASISSPDISNDLLCNREDYFISDSSECDSHDDGESSEECY